MITINKKEKYFIYTFFTIVYIFFIIYNIVNTSGWLIDSILALVSLNIIFLVAKNIKLGKYGFILFNLAIIFHNLGTFNAYALNWRWLQYDSFVHLFGTMVAAYIVFNHIAHKLCTKQGSIKKDNIINKHKFLSIFLIFTSVVAGSTFVEIIEFLGFTYLGEGEGILFAGSGDYNKFGDVLSQYVDAMEDIIANTIGSFIGVLLYYFTRYRKNFMIEK